MTDLKKFLIKAYVRKALGILGGILITHGVLVKGEADSFAAMYLEEVVGAVLIGGSYLWTTAYQFYVKRKVLKAKRMSPDTTSAELERALQEESSLPVTP